MKSDLLLLIITVLVALSFDFAKFSHGHVSYDAQGTQSGTVSEGYDFTLNKAFDGPTPDADIGFFL